MENRMQDATSNSTHCHFPLSQQVLSSLGHLNLRFLSWLSARAKQPGNPRDLPLPWELQQRFAELTHDQCVALAQSPYALFDLKFHDEMHWTACLQCSAQAKIADGPSVDSHTRDFVQLALFYS